MSLAWAEVCAQYCRGCERNELACFDQEGMTWRLDEVCTYDIAMIVNAESRGKRGPTADSVESGLGR
jgi:hypothetical protein